MRVIAGLAKGRQLRVPQTSVRPTTGMIRGVIFSMLGSRIEGAEVLDLFAGSGALGIEALSRGAASVDFVDQNQRSCTTIRENLKAIGLDSQGHVYCGKASRAIDFVSKQYDLVFLDPPYADPSLDRIMEQLASSAVVKPTTMVVVSHSSRRRLKPSYGHFGTAKERCHGDTCVSFLQSEANP